MQMDRARSLQIDREDMDESGVASLAGKILGEYVRTKVIPECDAYVLSKLGAIAKEKGNTVNGDLSAPFEAFCELANNVYAAAGYDTELVCFMDSAAYAALMSSDELNHSITVSDFKQGEINLKVKSINGISVIPVVSERMKTIFNFKNTEAGGFAPANGANGILMLMLPKTAAHLVKKTEKMRVFTPEQNATADAYKFDYRIYYDCFVKTSATDGVWAWLAPAVTVEAQPEGCSCVAGAIDETLSVSASTDGDAITYQWFKSSTPSGKGAVKLIGATAETYALPEDLEQGNHYYFCKITADKQNTVRSDVASVTVE